MRLNYRPARASELADCFTQFGEAFAYPAELRPRVPALWRRWVENGQMITQLVEDHSDLGRPRAVGFGAAVFLSPAFADLLRKNPGPFARAELARRALAGEAVVLDPADVPAANRGPGLSLFFVNDALTNRALDDAALHLVHERWSEALYELRAFRLRELFWELYSAKIQRWSEGCGLLVRRAWPDPLPDAAAEPDRRMFLVGLNAAEVKQNPGTHGSYLFAYVPPRFDFTSRQQELLKLALEGRTDNTLATAIGVSLPAVKKRWAAIYEHVSAKAPGWLETEGDGGGGEKRGAEKRRHLLHYLRQHPEELHPANATSNGL